MKKIIDLRSDTVTKPSFEMRKAMYDAEVGDDVYGEDPTTNELQEYAADLLGKESALFVTSGVMGNQICLNILTNPGDEVICEKDAHIFWYESGSPAKLSGLQIHQIEGIDGSLPVKKVKDAIRPQSAYYMPESKVIEVENTHNVAGGTIIPLENIIELRKLADENNLFMHLDGARIWNASVASGILVNEYAKYFDTVSCCLSKGLGAPIGSIIAGSKELMHKAFRVRKSIGGGMRQVGIIAAAGLFALKNNISRLSEDHEKAKILAERINANPNLEININSVQTNMLMFHPRTISVEQGLTLCKENGLLLSGGKVGLIRIVTHLDVTFDDVKKSADIIDEVFS